MAKSWRWWLLPVASTLWAIGSVGLWLRPAQESRLVRREPDEAIPEPKDDQKDADPSEALTPGTGRPSDLQEMWPQFRGPDRSNVVQVPLTWVPSWPASGPEVLWAKDVGEGHAGPAVRNGCVYLVDYDREKEQDAIRCLSLDDGEEIWRYAYRAKVKRNHGMSRTVPCVTDSYVVALGPLCDVHCLDAHTGQLVWRMDMVEQFGTQVPAWYAGQCPLIEGNQVILAPGADPLMMGVDLASGQILWQTPNPGGWGMTHSSILAMPFKGQEQFLYCSTQGVVSVSAEDGRLLWTKPDWKITIANVPTPLKVGDDRVFLSGGYKSGAVMIQLLEQAGTFSHEETFKVEHTTFGAEQQTPILFEDRIYGVAPNGEMACLDLQGQLRWTSGKDCRFGLGPFLAANRTLFALQDQEGTLCMIELNPDSYRELARAKILDGHDAWGPMALVADRLLLRDLTRLVCLKLPTL